MGADIGKRPDWSRLQYPQAHPIMWCGAAQTTIYNSSYKEWNRGEDYVRWSLTPAGTNVNWVQR